MIVLCMWLLSCGAPERTLPAPPAPGWAPLWTRCPMPQRPQYAWGGDDAALPAAGEQPACMKVIITLPDRIDIMGPEGTVTALVHTNVPPGEYTIHVKDGKFVVAPWPSRRVVIQVQPSEQAYPLYASYLQQMGTPVPLLVVDRGIPVPPAVHGVLSTEAQERISLHLAGSRPLDAADIDALLIAANMSPDERRAWKQWLSATGAQLAQMPVTAAGIRDALHELVNHPMFTTGTLVSISLYTALWLAPEPIFSKASAVLTTIGLISTVGIGVSEIIQVARAWHAMQEAARDATTLAELEQAAAHLGAVAGDAFARMMVALATLTAGKALTTARGAASSVRVLVRVEKRQIGLIGGSRPAGARPRAQAGAGGSAGKPTSGRGKPSTLKPGRDRPHSAGGRPKASPLGNQAKPAPGVRSLRGAKDPPKNKLTISGFV